MVLLRNPAEKASASQAGRRVDSQHIPESVYVFDPLLTKAQARSLSNVAVRQAQALAPKLTGDSARRIKAFYGPGYFGIKFADSYLWVQNSGSKPFTMKSLAGKVIPMWIDDPLGKEARANPKAKTRVTVSGRRQVLIFRKAAKMGARKKVAQRDSRGRLVRWRDVPASYPGAPGRIARREASSGRIASHAPSGHSGVRWRHPGIQGRHFMDEAVSRVAYQAGLENPQILTGFRRRR